MFYSQYVFVDVNFTEYHAIQIFPFIADCKGEITQKQMDIIEKEIILVEAVKPDNVRECFSIKIVGFD